MDRWLRGGDWSGVSSGKLFFVSISMKESMNMTV